MDSTPFEEVGSGTGRSLSLHNACFYYTTSARKRKACPIRQAKFVTYFDSLDIPVSDKKPQQKHDQADVKDAYNMPGCVDANGNARILSEFSSISRRRRKEYYMYSTETLRCMGAHRQYFVTTTMKGSKFTKIRAFSFVSTRPRIAAASNHLKRRMVETSQWRAEHEPSQRGSPVKKDAGGIHRAMTKLTDCQPKNLIKILYVLQTSF